MGGTLPQVVGEHADGAWCLRCLPSHAVRGRPCFASCACCWQCRSHRWCFCRLPCLSASSKLCQQLIGAPLIDLHASNACCPVCESTLDLLGCLHS